MRSGLDRDGEFAEFYLAHFTAARRYANTICGDWSEAEELTQQAFVRIYARWPKVRSETAEAYLRKTLTRLFLDTKRRGRAREVVTADPPDTESGQELSSFERGPMRAALLRLPKKQRAVVLLRFVYDLSVEDVAAALGCSDGTVKSQASRGLTALRGVYDEQQTQEAWC